MSSPVSSPPAMLRHPANPVLSPRNVPYPSTLTFNAGVVRHAGRYLMVFRNDFGRDGDPVFDGTNIGLATSPDGIDWTVDPNPILTTESVRSAFQDLFKHRYAADFVRRIYDPRLTVIEDRIFMCFAIDTSHGVCGGVATTEDFKTFTWLNVSAPENRNMVLFPRRIGGNFVRLERPFPGYLRKPEDFPIWLAESPDMGYWGRNRPVLGPNEVPFANSKIGPAAPPVETPRGWLCSFHGVWKDPERRLRGWEPAGWFKTYHAGLMLLDLENPSRVLGMMRTPLIEPVADYEADGFRGSVIFPCGMILESSGEVKLYYGAADTCVALATAHVDDLIARCEPLR